VYQVQEKYSASSVAEELEAASQSLLQGLEGRRCVLTRLGAKVSSGIIDVLKGWMPLAQNPALMLAGVAVVSPATVKILPDLGLLSVGCVLWLEQHILFVQVTLKWSKDRFIRRLQFTGILTWKAGQCSMAGRLQLHYGYGAVVMSPQTAISRDLNS
jgi:hypothetical protein